MTKKKIRYAVVGLGWIAQDVVLPAFANAENSQLTAFVSDDPKKLKQLGKKYKVAHQYSYKEYEQCLTSGMIDAVYIALPNSMHREYTVRAAQAGIHVLCEKPMAITETDCVQMREAVRKFNVKLMIAYRLHFEEGNLKAVDIAQSGKLGDIRFFNSTFTMTVEKGNVRLDKKLTGGSLYDIGIYSINAARYIFQEEPSEVMAFANGEDIHAVLRFSKDRMANIICSFNAASTAAFEVIGTKGSLRVDPAFHHKDKVKHYLKIGEQKKETVFKLRDQFAPELIYFSDCIAKNKNPEPSGVEGQADVHIIEAIYESARLGKAVVLKQFHKTQRPTLKQKITRFGVLKPKMVRVKGPSKK